MTVTNFGANMMRPMPFTGYPFQGKLRLLREHEGANFNIYLTYFHKDDVHFRSRFINLC